MPRLGSGFKAASARFRLQGSVGSGIPSASPRTRVRARETSASCRLRLRRLVGLGFEGSSVPASKARYSLGSVSASRRLGLDTRRPRTRVLASLREYPRLHVGFGAPRLHLGFEAPRPDKHGRLGLGSNSLWTRKNARSIS